MEIDSGPVYISKTFIAFANFGKFISLIPTALSTSHNQCPHLLLKNQIHKQGNVRDQLLWSNSLNQLKIFIYCSSQFP